MADRRSKFKDRTKDLQRGSSEQSLLAPMPLTAEETASACHHLGHDFKKKTYYHPTYCQHCTDLLWGLKGQGFQCTVCNFVTHEKCMMLVKVPCLHVIAQQIHDPVAHRWTRSSGTKRKSYCNICRKRIHSLPSLCEVCKYYSHSRCQSQAFNDCKKLACYAKDTTREEKHHWIEGNLPTNAKCIVCVKSCFSSDCLTGFRCGWCGLTVHSACIDTTNMNSPVCTFRDLWHMVLLPRAVSFRSSLRRDPSAPAGTPLNSDEMTPLLEEEEGKEEVDDEGEGEERGEGEGGQAKGEDVTEKGRPCLVVDGRGKKAFKKWRNTTLHPTYITKATKASELLAVSLKKLGISDNPEDYFLVEVVSSNGDERELLASEFPYFIRWEGYGPLKLYLRSRTVEAGRGYLMIGNGQLDLTSIDSVTVQVTNSTMADEVVKTALIKFELEDADPELYCLVEVSQIVKEGVKERPLNGREFPWQQMKDLRKDSLRSGYHQRYYLRHKEGHETVVYLWNLPKEALEDKDKCVGFLKKLIEEAPQQMLPDVIMYDRMSVGPLFPSMGGAIVHFPTYDLAMKITAALEVSHAKVIVLPTIHPEMVAEDQEPLLVFVNRKSGGNQGKELLTAFKRHLNPHQVFDLLSGGPIPGLYAFRKLPSFRILIGGGDGTFGWVLGALEEVRGHLLCRDVPSGLLPLGTGNDLARVLKWGGGYTGEKIMQVLLSLEDADAVELDRWEVIFSDTNGKKSTLFMNNYFGLGLDAAIALGFHNAREENPEKFNSRFHNKGVYLQLGLQKMISRSTVDLQESVHVYVDEEKVDLPDVKGFIFLNIQSWGSGADLWGTGSDPPSRDDFRNISLSKQLSSPEALLGGGLSSRRRTRNSIPDEEDDGQ